MLASLLFIALALASLVFAGPPPTLHYPLQSQLPPVARVNSPFRWSLLPDTFLSGASLAYSAQDMPDWLSFDANSLTFSGLPSRQDIGNNYVVVQANASDNAIGTRSGFHCLVVDSNDDAPVVTAPIAQQLSDGRAVFSSSYLQTDGSIRIPPRWSFSIGFQQYTVTDPDGSEIYYTAYRAGTTSLPSWMTFDNTTVTFDGLAPSNENNFEIVLHASDYYGYSDVAQSFRIVIGSHSFVLVDPLPQINATARDQISYNIPISGLRLDGNSVSAANITDVSVDLSNNTYLSYDASSRTISGTLPSELPNTGDLELPVTFTSAYNNTLIANITLNIIPQLFASNALPSYNITGGKPFTGDLSQYLISSSASYTAAFTPSSASQWLRFDNGTRKLTGTPPAMNGENVSVNITAQDPISGITESSSLSLRYTGASGALQPGHGGLSNGAKIAIAVIFGILGGLILLGIILFLCKRYCNKDEHEDNDTATAAGAGGYAEKSKEKNVPLGTPISTARLSTSSTESDRLSQAIAAAELSVANALAQEQGSHSQEYPYAQEAQPQPQGPRRMDMFNFLGGLRKQPSATQIPMFLTSENSGRSIKQMLGLSPKKPNHHPARDNNIIVVTDGDGYTYRPASPQDTVNGSGEGAGAGDLNVTRSEGTRSSFDSHQSSSLFYSEESGGSYVDSPVQRPRMALVRDGTPRSIPRQRKDFLPYQAPSTGMVESRNMSPSPSRMPSGGIRLVQPNRQSGLSISDSDEAYNADLTDYNAGMAADAAIATAHLEHLNSRASTYSRDSRATSRPRLIPFTSERRGERADSPPERRYPSQKGLASADSSREEGNTTSFSVDAEDNMQDADEDDDDVNKRYSAPYLPPRDGVTTSSIIFPKEQSLSANMHQQRATSPSKSARSVQSGRSRTNINSMVTEPTYMQVGCPALHVTAKQFLTGSFTVQRERPFPLCRQPSCSTPSERRRHVLLCVHGLS